MRDKETGLTLRTVNAVDKYIEEVYILKHPNYTFAQALRDAGYTDRYVHSFGSRIWRNMGVQTKINSFKAKMMAKAEIILNVTLEEVVNNARWLIEFGKDKGRTSAVRAGNYQLGCTIAAFKENITTPDIEQQRKLEEKEQDLATEIGKQILISKYQPLRAKKGTDEAKIGYVS